MVYSSAGKKPGERAGKNNHTVAPAGLIKHKLIIKKSYGMVR